MSVDSDLVRTQVEQHLPAIENESQEELFANIGRLACQPPLMGAAPMGAPLLSREQLVRAGRKFVEINQDVRNEICKAANKGLITQVIDTANITCAITILAPVLGFPPTAVPVVAISLVVVILRIGIEVYCHEYTSPATSTNY